MWGANGRRTRGGGEATVHVRGAAWLCGLFAAACLARSGAAQPAPPGTAGTALPGTPGAVGTPGPAPPEPTPPFPLRMRLEVVRAAGAEACPSREDLENRITVLLGGEGPPFTEDATAKLVMTLEPEPDGRGYRGRNEIHTGGGAPYRREMGPLRDCSELASSLALSFVVYWQTVTAAARLAATVPEGAAPSSSPSAQAPRPSPAARVSEPSSSPGPALPPAWLPVCKFFIGGYCVPVDIYSLGLSTGLIMTLGYTSDPGLGVFLGAELRPIEPFSFELQLRGILPARVVASEPIDPSRPYGTPKEPDFSSVAMLLVPCFRYSYFLGCVVGQFGFSVFNTPAGAAIGQSIGAGPRLGVEVPFLERFAVRVWGDAIFEIPPVTYTLEDVNLEWKQSLVAGFLGAGLVMSFK